MGHHLHRHRLAIHGKFLVLQSGTRHKVRRIVVKFVTRQSEQIQIAHSQFTWQHFVPGFLFHTFHFAYHTGYILLEPIHGLCQLPVPLLATRQVLHACQQYGHLQRSIGIAAHAGIPTVSTIGLLQSPQFVNGSGHACSRQLHIKHLAQSLSALPFGSPLLQPRRKVGQPLSLQFGQRIKFCRAAARGQSLDFGIIVHHLLSNGQGIKAGGPIVGTDAAIGALQCG